MVQDNPSVGVRSIKNMPSFAPALETTLHNALTHASERRHEYATLEHLLLALIDDEHASKVMPARSEEHTSELQSLMRISYAVFCLTKKLPRRLRSEMNTYELNPTTLTRSAADYQHT